jgi:CRP/FNR family nitrogen fixation transcriptional regulator
MRKEVKLLRQRRLNKNPIDQIGTAMTVSGNSAVFRRGTPAKYIYKVKAGCVRTYIELQDDRRVDLAFYFPGDYFGLEYDNKTHSVFAEAVAPSTILAINAAKLANRVTRDIAVAKYLLDITQRELKRFQEYRRLLQHSADERVSRFLLAMRDRQRRNEIELVMPRRDIAHHLDLSIESVSRSLTRLHNDYAITIDGWRRVTVNV